MFRAKFIPRNPQKYRGDSNKIIARSSWEVSVMKFFDNHEDILEWSSEEIIIPYLHPEDGDVHNYFPDFYIKYKDKNGNELKEIIEVKPAHEAYDEKAKCDRSKKALAINKAKWVAAKAWCDRNNIQFRVITENSLFFNGKKNETKVRAKKPAKV